tara:strand:+ start:17036 stop:17911 length:876 start_codon:yes stop_codon:yes gene_type:complete
VVDIYTDGACLGNPGTGGWAAIVLTDGKKTQLKGAEHETTNNRMEIRAVVEGLASVPENSSVTVYTDSMYVINTMTKNWKRKANLDLWEKLDYEILKRSINWKWVKGHSGDPLNEEADSLANNEARFLETHQQNDGFTHLDAKGKANMVDVGDKDVTVRIAKAIGAVIMKSDTIDLIESNSIAKGDVLTVARIAGITAAKRTSDLIPLCHPIVLDKIDVELKIDKLQSSIQIESTVRASGKTGVEMEALTAVSVAALSIYDMCKAVDRGICIDGIRVILKKGGRSGEVIST